MFKKIAPSFKSILICWIFIFISIVSGQAAEKYKVGVENLNYFPLYSWDGNHYSGFSRDLLDLFADREGVTFCYLALPPKRLYKMFLRKLVDFKFPDSPNWGQAEKKGKTVFYSDGIIEYVDGVMVLPFAKGQGIKKLKKLGIVRGFTPFGYLEQIQSGQVELVENNSFHGLLKQAIKNRINGAYVNVAVARHVIADSLKLKDALVFDDKLPHVKASYQMSTLKYPKLLNALNLYLKTHQDDIEKLKKKYSVEIQ